MNKFSQIILSLETFKNKVDNCIEEFEKKEASDKKIYNDTTLLTRHAKNVVECQQKLDNIRHNEQVYINHKIDEIQEQLKAWVSEPIPQNQLNLICSLLSSGIELSGAEIESLRDSAGKNYFADRLIVELAIRNNLQTSFRPKSGIDVYINVLKRVIDEANIFVNGYCGKGNNREFLPDDVNKYTFYAACSCRPFKPSSNILAAAAFWDGAGIPGDRKTSLTNEDAEILGEMYKGCESGEQKSRRTEEILRVNPELKEILMLSAEYSQYVPAENPEGAA